MTKINFNEYCAPGATVKVEMIHVTNRVSLRVFKFEPPERNNNPAVVFVPGWISLMTGWKTTLREMTRDFKVYYIETREKNSSQINGEVDYKVNTLGQDIITLAEKFGLKNREYILFGSSLGSTVILDCCHNLNHNPLCLALVAPNAVFRVPKTWMIIVHAFYPGFYYVLKPVIKWYLRNFRLDINTDMAQYKKYCRALDIADPWKLKRAVIPFSKYEVWDLLPEIKIPTLIIGASKDVMHEPENLHKMISILPDAEYLDLETNTGTHSRKMVQELRSYLDRVRG